ARCKAIAPVPTAVVYPCDESSLVGAAAAAAAGIIKPILFGPIDKIRKAARDCKVEISKFDLVDAADGPEAANKAVAAVRAGDAQLLMKGSLHTDELM